MKNPLLMQIYADVTGRPMKVARSEQTCAVGAAIFGAVAAGRKAGGFANVEEAQQAICGVRKAFYSPVAVHGKVYADLYRLYRVLHDAFGTAGWSGKLNQVMKQLMALREKQRK